MRHCEGQLVDDKLIKWSNPADIKPKPCDLIEFYRGKYCHWAMCSENLEYVYSVEAEDKTKTKAKVVLKKLIDVANAGEVPAHRVVRINNKIDSIKNKGFQPKSVQESINAVKMVLNTYVPYNFLSTNCEYYCCIWKFGCGWTDQVEVPLQTLLTNKPRNKNNSIDFFVF